MQLAVTVASQLPWQDPLQEPVQFALASTEQDPEHEPEQPPLKEPPSHVGGVAVASKFTSHLAVQSITTWAATLHTPGTKLMTTVADALAAKAASIAVLALPQAVAVSSVLEPPRSTAIALHAALTLLSKSLEVTPKRALASNSASSCPLSKLAFTSAVKLRSQLPMLVGSPGSHATPVKARETANASRNGSDCFVFDIFMRCAPE